MGLIHPLAVIGRRALALLAMLGDVTLFFVGAVTHMVRPPFYGREFLLALFHIGWLSLPVVGMTAIFTGGALALQIYAGGARFNAEAVVPQIVAAAANDILVLTNIQPGASRQPGEIEEVHDYHRKMILRLLH